MDDKSVWMNGTNELERIAVEIRAEAQACERTLKLATSALIDHWSRIGELLRQARAHFPSDEHFGQWIVRAELDEVGNKNNRTAMRVIASHRVDIEKQARWLDSVPRTAGMFLQKLNTMREAFGQSRLIAASDDETNGEHVSHAHQFSSIEGPGIAENSAEEANFVNSEVDADAQPIEEAPSDRAEETASPSGKPRPLLADLPEELRPVLSTFPPNGRVSLQRIYRHGGKAFITWLAAKVRAGEIAPSANYLISPRSFISELHVSFGPRNWLISGPDRKPYDKKMGDRFMREFEQLKAAAQAGTTFDQYDYKRREKAFTVRAAKHPIAEDAPIRRYTAATPSALPTEARLADGTVLKPRPIMVCGQQIWPRSGVDYADVFMVIHYIEQCLMPLYREQTPETIGRDIATMGTHFWMRHDGRWPKIAEIFSAVGVAIRVGNRKNPQPRELWFMEIEPWRQKFAE
jgi:hypothetical protein